MRIRLVQVNSVVGDVSGNLERIMAHVSEAERDQVNIVVFPEMALAGYPPEDLLFRPSFLRDLAAAQETLAQRARTTLVIAGYAYAEGQGIRNAAAVMAQGRTLARVAKQHLPNYGVFDEARYFTPGSGTTIFRWGQWTLGVSICEDVWYPDGPYLRQARQGANLLINISASPFSRGKSAVRQQMLSTRADDAAAYLVWTNLVGAQDELVFDGTSAVFGPDGQVLARAKAFQEDVLTVELTRTPSQHRRWIDPRWRLVPLEEDTVDVVDVPLESVGEGAAARARVEPLPDTIPSLYEALCLGLKDYVQKNRFGDVVIGLSGGIDSALTATIAVDALGADRVHGVFMPSAITSDASYQDAKALSDNLGIDWRVIPISAIMTAFLQELSPSFGQRPVDLTEENLQARIRGTLLMGLSNKLGWLVLTTGNKSEMATGYSTLYGDMAGGFAVLKDVLKTEVFRLARYVNEVAGYPRIPQNVLTKPPSAELRPDQKDEDSLPPYAMLDQILQGYIEDDLTPEELIRQGLDAEAVNLTVRLVNRNEYKRRQAPVGIKVTPRAFGRDRRMPITGRF
ncbi:MAG: NAD+ synthase [Firmicutes bacterium]|nr:NAD+ synthase [Bacillota bacterium]